MSFAIPDARFERPEISYPGRLPTGRVTIDTNHNLAPIGALIAGHGFVGKETVHAPGIVTGVQYGRRVIDCSAMATVSVNQPFAKRLFAGPHTIIHRSIWWTGAVNQDFFTIRDDAGYVHWWANKITAFRHESRWDDDVSLKVSPSAPFIDPSSGVWINVLHGSGPATYYTAQSVEGQSLNYGSTTAISTRYETDGRFSFGGINAALEFAYFYDRELTANQANSVFVNPYQFLIPA